MIKVIKNKWVLYFVVLCIGITIGDIIDYGYFTLDKSISVIDAFTLFITIGMTWYIASILDKQSKNKQHESELIIEQINEIEMLLKELEPLIKGNPSYIEINMKVHCIGLIKVNIFDSLKQNKDTETVNPYEIVFKDKLKKLKDLLTNTPIDKKDSSKITMKNGVLTYTDERIKEIITESYSFRTELFKLKLFISKV